RRLRERLEVRGEQAQVRGEAALLVLVQQRHGHEKDSSRGGSGRSHQPAGGGCRRTPSPGRKIVEGGDGAPAPVSRLKPRLGPAAEAAVQRPFTGGRRAASS